MKKVLLATTVLAMSATVAAAEVSLSGSARMGVAYNSEAQNELGFSSRARVQFNLSGESDNGLAFGASFRADNAASASTKTGNNENNIHGRNNTHNQTAGSVFVSGAFGKLSMGDVDGAAEAVTGDFHGVGFTNLGDVNENTFLSNASDYDRTAARYDYTTAGFTFSLSADNPANDPKLVNGAVVYPAGVSASTGLPLDNTGNAYGVGVGYAFDGYKLGLGYETQEVGLGAAKVTVEQTVVSAEGTFGDVTVKALYGDFSGDNTAGFKGYNLDKQYGLSAAYKADALTVSGFYRVMDHVGTGDTEVKFTGIGASYDLGGGAKVMGGLVDVNAPGSTADETRADLGLSFNF